MPIFPLEHVPESARRAVLWAAWLTALASGAALMVLDGSLRTPATPLGIVSFELCAFGDGFPAAIEAYRAVPLALGMSLGVDYLFAPAYAVAIGAGLVFSMARSSDGARAIARVLAWGVALAGLLDMIENAALYRIASMGEAPPMWAWAATGPATVKLVLIVVALLGWIGLRIRRRRG